jgi:hypothetical protein
MSDRMTSDRARAVGPGRRISARAALALAAVSLVLGTTGSSAGTAASPRPPTDHPQFAIHLPPGLAGEQAAYARRVTGALYEVAAFFRSAGFEVDPAALIDSVEVLEWSPSERKRLAASFGVHVTDIPETFSGTVIGKTLYLVTEKRYRAVWAKLYPSWPWSERTYSQLMVHELAHRAHEAVAIARTGSSDAMGQTWFFEGLAVACAGQFAEGETPMTWSEVLAQVGMGKTPRVSYPLYGRLVRSLVAKFGLRPLILHAAEPGFPERLERPAPGQG